MLVRSNIAKFGRRTDGAMTSFGVLLAITIIIVGGLAIDVANVVMARTHLQVAADSAAHAALVVRETTVDESVAKGVAIDIANGSLPPSYFGSTITEDDILFGTWDAASQVFTPSAGADDAVLVNTQRLAARQNSVGTYFLRFIGMNHMDVVSQSVFETYIPTCFREGFVAEGPVDVTSSNRYTSGFCIHSNSFVELNCYNEYEEGVIVSMPDRRDLVLPSAGFDCNVGLEPALRDGSYQLRILPRIAEIIAGVQDKTSPHYRSYITSDTPVIMDRNQKIDVQWVEGRIHVLDCANATQKAMAAAGSTMRRGILVTDCQLNFPENVAFEDAVIASENPTAGYAISAAEGFRLGKADNCADGGDAQIVTRGGVKFAMAVEFHNGQVIAAKDISFTSNAGTINGVSLVSGGTIHGTTESMIGFCGGEGMENNFYAWYFRLAA